MESFFEIKLSWSYLTHSKEHAALCLLPDTLYQDQFKRVVGYLKSKRNIFEVGIVNTCVSL
jgi:hypothetical protein